MQRRYDSLQVDNRPQQTIGESCCPQCGNPCDAGLIFCAKCGAVLRPQVALIKSSLDDSQPAPHPRLIVRIFLKVIRIVAGIAAVVAVFCPFSTFTLIFVFLGSIIVLLICHAALMAWDAKYFGEHSKDSYWPSKPTDWNPTSTGQQAARKQAGEENS
jgi:hypothetical protein